MCPLHIHAAEILAPDLYKLKPSPALMDSIHDSLGDSSLPNLKPLLQPYALSSKPLQLRWRQRQLRNRGCVLGRPRPRPHLLLPVIMLPTNGAARLRDRMRRRAPARINGVADTVIREVFRGGDEYLTCGARAGWGLLGWGRVLYEAEAAKLLGNAVNGRLGKGLIDALGSTVGDGCTDRFGGAEERGKEGRRRVMEWEERGGGGRGGEVSIGMRERQEHLGSRRRKLKTTDEFRSPCLH